MFIIAGFPRCGTSSLFDWLCSTGLFCGPPFKEMQYWVDKEWAGDRWTNSALSPESYLAECSRYYKPGKLFVDASPAYVYQQNALDYLPNLRDVQKYIFVVRFPVRQLLSIYGYFQGNRGIIGREVGFEDFVLRSERRRLNSGHPLVDNAVVYSRYGRYVAEWQARVGTDRFILLDEKAFRDVDWLYEQISGCLEVGLSNEPLPALPRTNSSDVYRSSRFRRMVGAIHPVVKRSSLYPSLKRLKSAFQLGSGSSQSLNDEAPFPRSKELDAFYSRLYSDFAPFAAAFPATSKFWSPAWQKCGIEF